MTPVDILRVPERQRRGPTCLRPWDSRHYRLGVLSVASGPGWFMMERTWEGLLESGIFPLRWDEARKVRMGQALASTLKSATLSSTPSSEGSGGAEGRSPLRSPSCTLSTCSEFSKGLLSSWARGRGWWRPRRQYLQPSSTAPTKQMMNSTRKYKE